jgi:Tfp pilus assembly protein PilO
VGSFLAEIANLGRIINVSALTLTAPTDPEMEATVLASFTATAYSLNPSPVTQGVGGKKDAS